MSLSSYQKSVLITGCSAGGIGDALAQSFHRRGLRVFATARNLSKIQHLRGMGMEILELDVTNSASLKNAVEQVNAATRGTLDILINNAGAVYTMPLLDAELDSVRKLFELNVFGVLATSQAFSPLLLKSKGTLVNISSLASVSPIPWQGPYCATKAALNQISDTLRQELSPFGVKVIVVITGSVMTNIHKNDMAIDLPEKSLYKPAKDIINRAVSGEDFAPMEIGVEAYAEKVVNNVLKSRPTVRQWAGGMVTPMWLIYTFLWETFWDLAYAGRFGLTGLKKEFKAKSD